MENYIQIIELINKYLNKALSEKEVRSFENRLKTDSDFNVLFDEHITFLEGLKRQQLKSEIAKAKQGYINVKWLKFFGVSFVVLTIVAIAYVLVLNQSTDPIKNNNQELNKIIIDAVSDIKPVKILRSINDSILLKNEKLKPIKKTETLFTKTPQKVMLKTEKKLNDNLNKQLNSFSYDDKEYRLSNCDVANEGLKTLSKWEIDLSCCRGSFYEQNHKVKSLIHLNIKSKEISKLNSGTYRFTNGDILQRNPFTFSGKIIVNTKEYQIKDGTFDVEIIEKVIDISFNLKVSDGKTVTGNYKGKYNAF